MNCPHCDGRIIRRRLDGQAMNGRGDPAQFRDICGDCGWPDPLRPSAGDLPCDVGNSLMGRRWTAR